MNETTGIGKILGFSTIAVANVWLQVNKAKERKEQPKVVHSRTGCCRTIRHSGSFQSWDPTSTHLKIYPTIKFITLSFKNKWQIFRTTVKTSEDVKLHIIQCLLYWPFYLSKGQAAVCEISWENVVYIGLFFLMLKQLMLLYVSDGEKHFTSVP